MLLEDEKYVVKWLSQYGTLPRKQIVQMLQKPPDTAKKIINNLKRRSEYRKSATDIIWHLIL